MGASIHFKEVLMCLDQHRRPRWIALCWLAASLACFASARATGQEESAEEAQQRVAMERFLSVLEKNPRRGTALDRVYGYHIERGTLDMLIKTLTERTGKQPTDGAAWMIRGLIEWQRGKDAQAVAALTEAEKHLPNNPLASYYLGQSLVLIGQPDEAVKAFERSIARKPAPADLLEVFQALG